MSAGDSGHRGKPASARPSKPTPVRALDDAPPTRREEPGPPPERVTLDLGARTWTAEVAGHAVGAGGAHILLVRFVEGGPPSDSALEHAPGPEDTPSDGALEAWVVGGRLEDVPRWRLEEALGRAAPWKGSSTDQPFFADEGGRRGR